MLSRDLRPRLYAFTCFAGFGSISGINSGPRGTKCL